MATLLSSPARSGAIRPEYGTGPIGSGMLRFRLALTISVSFGFVLLLGLVLYWGSRQVALYFHRSQAAYEVFDRYERLSEEAYRHFKQRMDLLLLDNAATGETDLTRSRQRLSEAIGRLRDTISREADAASEAERAARLIAFLEASLYRFDEIEQLRLKGQRDTATRRLSRFLEEEIDRKFAPLIDAAIDGERQEALEAEANMAALIGRLHGIALLAASTAACFGLTAGIVLFRGIQKPIEALMRGTEEIAAGHLTYRIPLAARDEFGYLAGHFNRMAGQLEIQQDKLREAKALLEHKVAERTLELNKLNRELQQQDRARREFFADLSHELRTPLTVIRGEAEVTLRSENSSPRDYQDALQRILELARQLTTLVNDMLFLARTEAAQMHFEWETLDLTELVAGAAEDLAILAREKHLAVTLETPETPVRVHGDRQRLRQVLFILGDNACRYSNPGGQIRIALNANASSARLSLEDQGIGIPAQDLEAIFERYFRAGNARAGSEGTGLGLPMARAIVTAHGGQITAASREGEGTIFTVSLPRLR